jgi:hypothetical protein
MFKYTCTIYYSVYDRIIIINARYDGNITSVLVRIAVKSRPSPYGRKMYDYA